MNRRVGLRRRGRRRKHILVALAAVVLVAAVTTGTVLLVKNAKKVPKTKGKASQLPLFSSPRMSSSKTAIMMALWRCSPPRPRVMSIMQPLWKR